MKIQAWMILAAGLLFCVQAQAQRMYRCGNQYQDIPCGSGQKSQTVNTSGSGKTPGQASSDPECARRGAAAQKMMITREAGVTREKQIAEADAKNLGPDQNLAEKNLIASVYGKRGSTPEVRGAIEAECMIEKDRAAQVLALRQAAAALEEKGVAKPAAASATTQPSTAAGASTQSVQSSGASSPDARDAAARKARCDGFTSQLDSIRNSQRASGSTSQMETLNERRRGIENQQRAAGC